MLKDFIFFLYYSNKCYSLKYVVNALALLLYRTETTVRARYLQRSLYPEINLLYCYFARTVSPEQKITLEVYETNKKNKLTHSRTYP